MELVECLAQAYLHSIRLQFIMSEASNPGKTTGKCCKGSHERSTAPLIGLDSESCVVFDVLSQKFCLGCTDIY